MGQKHYKSNDASHDWDHVARVLRLALTIAKKEKADEEVVAAAVIFHDWVKLHPTKGKIDKSSAYSARAAEQILNSIKDFPAEKIAAVKRAIYEHTFSLGIRPKSVESRAVQDADRLDSMGAVGIMRIFAFAGAIGARLFCTYDPFCRTQRTPEAYRYGLDWVPARLKKLPARMNTPTGKKMARMRVQTLKLWMASLERELKESL